jgi:hypothetical protein
MIFRRGSPHWMTKIVSRSSRVIGSALVIDSTASENTELSHGGFSDAALDLYDNIFPRVER